MSRRTVKGTIDLEIIEDLCRNPVLTEEIAVEDALKFANCCDLAAFKSVSGIVGMVELPRAFYEEERAALRSAFMEIINARDGGSEPASAALWRERRSRVVDVFDKNGGQHFLVLDNLPRATDSAVGFAYASPLPQFARLLLLFLDAQKPYGRDLCQCQLKSCGKFFFAIRENKSGMPRRKYCTQEHMLLAQEPVSVRVRRSRENLKREQASKRRGKWKS